MGEKLAKNGDRSDAGTPRTGSHEAVITGRKQGHKTGKVAGDTGYGKRRVQQIWSNWLESQEGREWLTTAEGKEWLARKRKNPVPTTVPGSDRTGGETP